MQSVHWINHVRKISDVKWKHGHPKWIILIYFLSNLWFVFVRLQNFWRCSGAIEKWLFQFDMLLRRLRTFCVTFHTNYSRNKGFLDGFLKSSLLVWKQVWKLPICKISKQHMIHKYLIKSIMLLVFSIRKGWAGARSSVSQKEDEQIK